MHKFGHFMSAYSIIMDYKNKYKKIQFRQFFYRERVRSGDQG